MTQDAQPVRPGPDRRLPALAAVRSGARGDEPGGHRPDPLRARAPSGGPPTCGRRPPPRRRPAEAPECAWCPLCRAARVAPGSEPGPAAGELPAMAAGSATALTRRRAPRTRLSRPVERPLAAPAAAAPPAAAEAPSRPGTRGFGGTQPGAGPGSRPRGRPAARPPSRSDGRLTEHRRSAAGTGSPRKSRRMSLTIGVDVGGTKVAAGVVDEQGHDRRETAPGHPRGEPGPHRRR